VTTLVLHLTDGQTLTHPAADIGTVTAVRDDLAETITSGATINLNTPGRVLVVNSAHVMFAEVTP
jgi:hypothetical protein